MHRHKNMNLSVPFDPDDYYRTCRGLPSYDESDYNILVGGDLLAAQYAGYKAYANIQKLTGKNDEARRFFNKAEEVKKFYNKVWWDNENQTYYSAYLGNGRFKTGKAGRASLYFGIVGPSYRSETILNQMIEQKVRLNIESLSHYPEIFYRFGRNNEAYEILLYLTDEKTRRREYPEVSFAVIGAIVNGMMGIEPNSVENTVYTLPRLTSETEWVEVKNVPVLNCEIDVKHTGIKRTELLNKGKNDLVWVALFPSAADLLFVNGKANKPQQEIQNGRIVTKVRVVVKPDQRCWVEMK